VGFEVRSVGPAPLPDVVDAPVVGPVAIPSTPGKPAAPTPKGGK